MYYVYIYRYVIELICPKTVYCLLEGNCTVGRTVIYYYIYFLLSLFSFIPMVITSCLTGNALIKKSDCTM